MSATTATAMEKSRYGTFMISSNRHTHNRSFVHAFRRLDLLDRRHRPKALAAGGYPKSTVNRPR
jgi:hypothetical protein